MNAPQPEHHQKISSPEKVARVLEKVGISGVPLILRALSSPTTSVKGRAIPVVSSIVAEGFKIGNISDRGLKYLAENSAGGIQVEFILMSAKVVFNTRILRFARQECVVALPAFLVSIERRKDARFTVSGNARAFIAVNNWHPDPKDLATAPFFESSRDLASLIPVGDISMGGISIVSRFPTICTVLDRGQSIEQCQIYLPMSSPISIIASIRWCKRLKEVVNDPDGRTRVVRTYKFGIQFVNPSEELIKGTQLFMQKISQADAI